MSRPATNYRIRRNFGRIKKIVDIPNLVDIQKRSYEEFLQEKVSPEERRAIEFRYYKGLDGEELARALGVSTPGAARVRVCRALQALRTLFAPAEEEVFP